MSPMKDATALQRIYEFYDLQREMLLADPQTLRSPAVRREVERKLRAMMRLAQEVSRKNKAYLGGVDPIETARVIQHYLSRTPRLRSEHEARTTLRSKTKPARTTPSRAKSAKASKAKKVPAAKKKTAKTKKRVAKRK